VPFTKAPIQGAPHHDPGREITADDEDELYAYYSVGGTTVTATSRPRKYVTGQTATEHPKP